MKNTQIPHNSGTIIRIMMNATTRNEIANKIKRERTLYIGGKKGWGGGVRLRGMFINSA